MNKSSANYTRLLATVDLGDMTEGVVSRAVDLASRCEAGVDLVHILEGMPVFLYHAVSAEELRALLDKSERWSRERLEEIATRHPGVGATHTASGILAEEARDLVGRIGADLLVIGAHVRHGMAILFRDRSDEILHKAECDVLIVKQGARAPATEAPLPYRHLLAAVDLGSAGAQVAARAAGVARLYGAALTLVHVIDRFPVDRSNSLIAPEDQDPLAFEEEDTVRHLSGLAQQFGGGDSRYEVVVSTDTASREIPAFAAAKGADLIVVGSHGRHGLGRLLGSTADGVVHRSPCDVLVVRILAQA